MAEVGITVTAKDKTGKGFASASQGAEQLKGKWERMSGVVKQAPEQFGKAASAMLLFQSATAQMGGKVADAANKLTALAALVATGGPIGIALAALTVAVLGISKAYEKLTESSKRAEIAMKRFSGATADTWSEVFRLRKEYENLGKTQRRVQIEELKKSIEVNKAAIVTYGELGKLSNKIAAANADNVDVLSKRIDAEKALLAELEKLETVEDKEERRTVRRARRQNEKAARLQAMAGLEKDIEQGLADIRQQNINRRMQLEESLYVWQDQRRQENLAREKEASDQRIAMIQQYGSTLSNTLGAAIADEKNAGKIMARSAIDTATSAANAALMSAVMKAADAGAWGGPLAAAVSGGIAMGLLKGLMAKLMPKAAFGGEIMSGTPGKDTVPILAQRGEGILTTGQTIIMKRLADALEGQQGLQPAGAVAGGGMTVNLNSVVPVTSGEYRRSLRQVHRDMT